MRPPLPALPSTRGWKAGGHCSSSGPTADVPGHSCQGIPVPTGLQLLALLTPEMTPASSKGVEETLWELEKRLQRDSDSFRSVSAPTGR